MAPGSSSGGGPADAIGWRPGAVTRTATRRNDVPSTCQCIMANPIRSVPTLTRSGEARQVVIGVAEGLRDRCESPERVADLQLLGHTHAAVQLHRLLAHVTGGVGDLDLGRRDDATALRGVGGLDLTARPDRARAQLH